MYFSSKVMTKNAFLQNGGYIKYPKIAFVQTAKDVLTDKPTDRQMFLLLVSKIMTNLILFKDERLSMVRYKMKWMMPSDSMTFKSSSYVL